MNLILATFPIPGANEFTGVLWSIVALLSIISLCIGIAVGIKVLLAKPAERPLRIQGEVRMATWDEMQQINLRCEQCRKDFKAEIERITDRIENELKDMIAQSSKARKDIYDTIREVEAIVHRIEGKMEK